ncbi:PKD domain-containing protein [Kitasatospora sp. NPDC049258]|uniref:right-handed parallel beta-helix repeat-containing protein n=1 Tax=Kitasatospora sp. NPDC049258 TaxID=3155394 RepID=UPI00341D5912
MRINRTAALTAACITGLLGLPAPFAAAAEPVGALHVNNAPDAHCTDQGTGTAAAPYCTISAAVGAVQAGQTIEVAANTDYSEHVRITKSGTEGHPIVIHGAHTQSWFPTDKPSLTTDRAHPAPLLEISGAHDVSVQGFVFDYSTDPVVVDGSSRIELDDNYFEGDQLPAETAAVRITGPSDQVRVTRSLFYLSKGISVGAGAQHTTISRNDLNGSIAGAVRVTDAPGTLITNNTVSANCGAGIELAGASTGAVIENNIVVGSSTNGCPQAEPKARISVPAGSTPQTTVDYNLVDPAGGQPGYYWGDSFRGSVEAFRAASGQGAHDRAQPVGFDGSYLPFQLLTGADTAAVDAGDPEAPGVPALDLMGRPTVDDPYVANTGPGGGYRDLGAYELHGLTSASLLAKSAKTPTAVGPGPLQITLTASASNGWPTTLTYTYDFGDGSAPLTTTQTAVQHTYTAVGDFSPRVTVTDGIGGKAVSPSWDAKVTVRPAGELTTSFTQQGSDTPLFHSLRPTADSPYVITGYTVDWGDGTTKDYKPWDYFEHEYARPGTYTVTVSAADEGGRTAKSSQQLTAAYDPAGYVATAPTRILDTRNPALPPFQQGHRMGQDQTMSMSVRTALNGKSFPVDTGATAVVLNLTATGATSDTFLTAFPNGVSTVPTASNLNVEAGHDVSNVVTVPVSADGHIKLYNHEGSVDVIADVLGYYKAGTGAKYTPVAPARLLDTRSDGKLRLGGDGVRSLKIAGGNHAPVSATAVALNVTAVGGSADSFLTVYPSGSTRPAQASNVNFGAGKTVPNQVIVPVGADGSIDIYNHVGTVDVIVDIFGYYSAADGSLFTPVVPQRLIDTRSTNGKLGQDKWLAVKGVPAGATAAALNVTATEADSDSHLIVWADGATRPDTSNLNTAPGLTTPNHVITPVGPQGSFDIYNHMGSTHVIADLFGYFTKG